MIRYAIATVALNMSLAMALAPEGIAAWIAGTCRPSRLWVRLAGVLGAIFVILRIVAPQPAWMAGYGWTVDRLAQDAQRVIAGVVIGLVIAIHTQGYERGEERRD